MKKFKTKDWKLEITEVEIIRETPTMIVFLDSRGKERKEGKVTMYDQYHDTYSDAIQYHERRISTKITSLQNQIDILTHDLVKVKLMATAEPTRTTQG